MAADDDSPGSGWVDARVLGVAFRVERRRFFAAIAASTYYCGAICDQFLLARPFHGTAPVFYKRSTAIGWFLLFVFSSAVLLIIMPPCVILHS